MSIKRILELQEVVPHNRSATLLVNALLQVTTAALLNIPSQSLVSKSGTNLKSNQKVIHQAYYPVIEKLLSRLLVHYTEPWMNES